MIVSTLMDRSSRRQAKVQALASRYILSAITQTTKAMDKDYNALSGSIHDHMLNFKADIGIIGLNNTLEKAIFISDTVKCPERSNITRPTFSATCGHQRLVKLCVSNALL